MGTPFNDRLTRFRDELEVTLRDRCGLDPRILDKNEYPVGNPLPKIVEVLRSCDGAVIVANDRRFVEIGQEKRGSSSESKLSQSRYTTSWNHIESALAFALGLPIYVISEKGVTQEGLIENSIDWVVKEIEFEPGSLEDPRLIDSLKTWADERVRTRSAHRTQKDTVAFDLSKLKLAEISVRDWMFIAGLASAWFGAGVAAAKFFPAFLALFHKP